MEPTLVFVEGPVWLDDTTGVRKVLKLYNLFKLKWITEGE